MSNNILVTIVCIAYNHEKYIESCINGFLMQKTSFNYEIIIHDDASTDRTPEIIRKYAEKESGRIKAIMQTENQYSKGENFIKKYIQPLIKGKYVALCEGDDAWIDETKLERQFSFMEKHPDYVACVHNTIFHRCDKKCKDFPMFVWTRDKDLEFQDIINWNYCGYQTSSLFVKSKYYVDAPLGYFDFSLAMYLVLSGKVRFISRNMSEYRFRSGVYSTRAEIYELDRRIAGLEYGISQKKMIYNYMKDDDSRKKYIYKLIESSQAGIDRLKKMTKEEYKETLLLEEQAFDKRIFLRANFQVFYRFYRKLKLRYKN